MENIATLNGNDIRSVCEEIKDLEIQETDLDSEIKTLKTKTNIGKKQINASLFQQKQIKEEIRDQEDKIKNCHFETKDREFETHKIELKNNEIREINSRLKKDLEAVNDHLRNLQKVNQLLNSKLE